MLKQHTDVATGLSKSARRAMHRRLADAVTPLLDVDLSAVAVKSWSTARKVRAASEATPLGGRD